MPILDRTKPPVFQLSKNYSLTQPNVISCPNGVTLFAFQGIQQEAVKLEIVFEAGKWQEPNLGISQFTAQMISKGTSLKTSFQIAESFETLGAFLEVITGFDAVHISLFALRKNFISAFQILIDILSDPSFDEKELKIMKENFVETLRINNKRTNVIATKEIRKAIFGQLHPYGGIVTEKDIYTITPTALKVFYENHFSIKYIFLIGRLNDQEIQEVINKLPSRSMGGNQKKIVCNQGVSQIIKRKDAVQASIRLGKRCDPISNKNAHFDMVLFNHVLGGYFGSRLMQNIREKKGLTYGIYSRLNHFFYDSYWVISTEVNAKKADQALAEIKLEIKNLQEKPIPTAELEMARNHFIGSWQTENSTLFSVAEKFKFIHLFNLSPTTYYNNLLTHIQHSNPKQIQHIAQTKFKLDDLIEIQVK